jgi:hypothetical protein
MPKKGVLGNKTRPLDGPEPTMGMAKMPEEPCEIRIRKAKSGGYIVRKSGGKLGYSGEDHVADTKEKAMELMEKHLG